MQFFDSNGNPVNSIDDWEKVFSNPQDKGAHWRELAEYMLDGNGQDEIKNAVSMGFEEKVFFDKVILKFNVKLPECEIEHDLGIWGHTQDGKTVFIGVEAKFGEPFVGKNIDGYFEARDNGKKAECCAAVTKVFRTNSKDNKKSGKNCDAFREFAHSVHAGHSIPGAYTYDFGFEVWLLKRKNRKLVFVYMDEGFITQY